MKNLFLVAAVAGIFFLASCGGGEKKDDANDQDSTVKDTTEVVTNVDTTVVDTMNVDQEIEEVVVD
jgi:protein involved in sex pheromone biosynthesis